MRKAANNRYGGPKIYDIALKIDFYLGIFRLFGSRIAFSA